ncbi:MAG: DNA polymerase III subunit gamma/tau [Candidatus Zixiibacteriota bacterium]|nr:MAG: DNA polymerase III subunit gamma/tau [candidate division Zixibacteria bacterium]
MSYLALARRYRPDDFSGILSQKHITRTLANAISSGRISHAYLFCGSRGTGKTTTARVMAKSLNCEKGPTPTPCGECINCREIKAGISPDVFEIDAASNRGIDDIRQLRENVRYSPASSRYKIYIIDEVHRLTNEAFDALLKTLEEPPPHVIFIFATTEPQSLPATILSRTQRFDFKRVPISALAETVNDIAAKEGLEIDPRAALMVARKADGSLRDALSLLDQLINFSQGMITTESASEILGLVKTDFLFKIIKAVVKHDTPAVLEMFNVYFDEGVDIDGLADELSIFLGKLLLVKNGVRETSILEMDISELEKAELLVSEIDTSDILRMLQIMADFTVDKKSGVDPVVAMEVALVRLSGLDKAVDIDELLSNLSNPVNMTRALSGHSVSKVVKATKSTSAEEGRSMDVGKKSGQAPFTRSQSTAIEHKLDNIANWWSNFLSFVKSKSLAVWSHLQYAKVSYNGSNLVDLGFPLGNEFHMKFLTGRRSFIIDCLKEFSGANPGVSFTRLENENNDLTDIPNIPKQSIEEFLNQHPKMKKLHDLIDGDDIRFRGNMQ